MSLSTINVGTVSPSTKLSTGAGPTNGGFQGDQFLSELHGRFYNMAYNGTLFIMDSDSVTLAAANTTKGAAGTIKLINGFVNPTGSGVNAEIIAAVSTWTSGTPTGALVYNAQSLGATSITSTATGTIRNGIINTLAASTTTKMTAQTGVVITRADSATTAFTQIGVHGGPSANATGAGLYSVVDECAGRYIIPPGCVFGLAQVGASTAVVQTTLFWAEWAI